MPEGEAMFSGVRAWGQLAVVDFEIFDGAQIGEVESFQLRKTSLSISIDIMIAAAACSICPARNTLVGNGSRLSSAPTARPAKVHFHRCIETIFLHRRRVS